MMDANFNENNGRSGVALELALWVAAAGAALVLLAANLLLGNLNQDEGWYLYAARLVAQGSLPYRDFAFSQGPLLPLVYAWVQPGIDAWGLAAGRAFTALLGLAAALAAALLAARLVAPERRRTAALATFILVLVNVYQSYYFSLVKTYALTALLLLTGLLALAVALRRHGAWVAAGAGALLALATATRTSAGIILPLAVVLLFLERRRLGFQAWFWLGLGAGLATCLALIPFWIMAPESFQFWVLEYHTLRAAGSLGQALVYKAGFVSRLTQGYFVAIAAWLVVLCARLFFGQPRLAAPEQAPAAPERLLLRLSWFSIAAVSLVHLSAPFPYEDYQAFIYPLFAMAVAVLTVNFVGTRAGPWLATALLVVSLGAAFSSPVNQDWFILGRDRIWWRLKEKPDLRLLQETGARLKAMSRPGDLLLTQDPYLAVEAGLTLPHCLEMGQFSYFPGFNSEQAARLHVLNRAQFETLLKSCPAPVAAFSGYGFAMRSPQVDPVPAEEQAEFRRLVEERYALVDTIPYFGQAHTTLRIYKKSP